MTKFVAIKINYDHRELLPRDLKYSTIPTLEQYNEYLAQYHDEGIGGNGFHECLNFKIPAAEPVRFYLPPTCLPSQKNSEEDFVIFSFTYKGDKKLPAHIVGVHAGAKILSTEVHGLSRGEDQRIKGIGPLRYHAEAPPDLVTLITPPIKYINTDGLFTPEYQSWGYGLRYIEEIHAENILATAYSGALKALAAAGTAERELVQRQITVLKNILKKYALELAEESTEQNDNGFQQTPSLPDKEIGYLGEKYIYERELEYVKSIGCKPQEVQWISQANPTAPFDIRTVRLLPTGTREHFIEVKSSISSEANVYVSSRQISFFKTHEDISTFSIVTLDAERNVLNVRELTLPQLLSEFDLVPIKYKLAHRNV
ncbi:MAG: DUF3883 domain-containing protein [Nitrosomonas sp.]|nr:DUF3883 domain-containing protein [Nitrosomonas sp.]